MEPTKTKKAWMMPELTVLVRSKPEEAVLMGCKSEFQGGFSYKDSACMEGVGECMDCAPSFMS